MDATEEVGEAQAIAPEQAENDGQEDHRYDTLDAALEAFDDGSPTEEEPPAEEEPEADEESEDDGVEVLLDSGDKVTLKELKAGYFRDKDYRHKTTEIANERKAIETTKADLQERTTVIETALQNLSGYLQSLIPPEPPLHLAQTDPGKFQYQMALRQNAIAELGQLVSMKQAVDEHKQGISEAEQRDYRAREETALLKVMPGLSDPARRASFDQSIRNAAKTFGFTDDEFNSTADNRILRTLHYAALGMRAEENRKNAARRVETPKLAKAKPAQPPVHVENRKAMHALTKSGSIKDALRVDFE